MERGWKPHLGHMCIGSTGSVLTLSLLQPEALPGPGPRGGQEPEKKREGGLF